MLQHSLFPNGANSRCDGGREEGQEGDGGGEIDDGRNFPLTRKRTSSLHLILRTSRQFLHLTRFSPPEQTRVKHSGHGIVSGHLIRNRFSANQAEFR